jgi:hypothetical protein
MRTIWQSLAWKEWHEHKWKLVSILVIMWGVALLPLSEMERGTLMGVRVVLVIGIIPLAIFVGLGTAAGERSRGTLQFLQALPVPMWRVALHKMALGLVTIVVPALLTLALAYAWCKGLDLLGVEYGAASDFKFRQADPNNPFPLGTNSWFLDSAIVVASVATSFYVWTIAFGVNRKDEVSAGAVALSAIVGWSLLLGIAWILFFHLSKWLSFDQPDDSQPWLPVAGLATAPGGLAPVAEIAKRYPMLLWFGLSVAAVTHLALATWYVRRFARISNLEIRSPKTAEVGARPLDWLGPPRRSPFAAIAWKQWCESGPIVLAGLAIVAGTTALFYFGNKAEGFVPPLGDVLINVSLVLGTVLAMVLGIGVMLYDVSPGLNTFWRSRPINADLWFWIKFLSGLAILLAAIYGPPLLYRMVVGSTGFSAAQHSEAWMYPFLHITIFAAAVAMTCLVRQAVYAAILSIAAAYLGIVAVGLVLTVGSLLGWVELGREYVLDLTESEVAVGLAISFVFCTVLAWLAVRNDWGQKAVR